MSEAFSIIDSHCHLDRFFHQGILDDTLSEAREAGVTRMIAVGTSDEDWQLYARLTGDHPGVIDYTVGLHPCNVEAGWENQVDQLRSFFQANGPRPVALGEIGLDHFHLPQKDREKAEQIKALQVDALRAQLEIVRDLDCPVVIHSRGAFEPCIQELDAANINWEKVVFHCFVESASAMKTLNDRGGRGSFTGVITFKNAHEVRGAAVAQGLDKLMVETDAPYLAPVPHRGKPCFPAYTALTAHYCAELLGVEAYEIAGISRKNTELFFGLK
ncbi:MAG: TatD family hydrolase [Verrucomicrobia bacterium]|nr:TatD family hydrolase [Verrucomicrobiota bacterium]